MNILWMSNSPHAGTGYGNQTKIFTRGLAGAGYAMDIFAFYGQEGYVQLWDGMRIFPRLGDSYGNDVVGDHLRFCGSELLITLIDPFVLGDHFKELPWCAWAPIDSMPMRRSNIRALKNARWIWAMSRFGEARLKEAGFENVRYVPHGVDFEVFKPGDRTAAREQMERWAGRKPGELQDKYIILMNAANKGFPSRKGFAYAFEAFAAVARPDWVLWLHTEASGMWQGEDLQALLAENHIRPEQVIFSPQYAVVNNLFNETHLNTLYNGADVLLAPSLGEGFGIPIVEAQAAGCPVIGTDCTAISELVRTGCQVAAYPFYNGDGMNQFIPSVGELGLALQSHANGIFGFNNREIVRARVEEYEWRRVLATRMIPAIEAMRAELEGRMNPAPTPEGAEEVAGD